MVAYSRRTGNRMVHGQSDPSRILHQAPTVRRPLGARSQELDPADGKWPSAAGLRRLPANRRRCLPPALAGSPSRGSLGRSAGCKSSGGSKGRRGARTSELRDDRTGSGRRSPTARFLDSRRSFVCRGGRRGGRFGERRSGRRGRIERSGSREKGAPRRDRRWGRRQPGIACDAPLCRRGHDDLTAVRPRRGSHCSVPVARAVGSECWSGSTTLRAASGRGGLLSSGLVKLGSEFPVRGLEGQDGSDARQIEPVGEESADLSEPDEIVVAVAAGTTSAARRIDQTPGFVEPEVLWSAAHQVSSYGDPIQAQPRIGMRRGLRRCRRRNLRNMTCLGHGGHDITNLW